MFAAERAIIAYLTDEAVVFPARRFVVVSPAQAAVVVASSRDPCVADAST